MRRFAFLLSLFIVVLSLVPCSDEDTCKESTIEFSSDHADHEHDEDSCTPFCACTCCGCSGFILATLIPHPLEFKEVKMHTRAATIYHSDFTSNYFYTFWQPPRI